MPDYDFKNLSPADFEDLSRDLLGKRYNVFFEAFSEGPDGGMDGRHSKGEKLTVLQAKHYAGSSISNLKSVMKKEKQAVGSLSIDRYILSTSLPLTPNRKNQLAEIISPPLRSQSDIYGAKDLNTLLRQYPNIERAHIKLWLTSANILELIVHKASSTYNDITLDEIRNKIQVFAPNPSLEQGQKILENNHVLIISGPPGVGKTTLAEMLLFSYLSDDWELVAIRSLDDGFGKINDLQKQIFFFDDFLGKISLDRSALSHKDSDLYKFLNRVQKSTNARFILTTRAYIFEEARRSSEYLADPLIDVSKYTLNVGIYTRYIKARILYNHLLISDTPREYVSSLLEKTYLQQIIDHPNYNPRIIEWMTDQRRLQNISAEQYPEYFLSNLNTPHRLWDTAFREHIPKKCQHLLFALFFCSEYGEDLNHVRPIYNNLHSKFSRKFGESFKPKDFEETLKILEGSFISIEDKKISFINPSLKDYLAEYLNDPELIHCFPQCAQQTLWAKRLWEFGKTIIHEDNELIKFSLSFYCIAEKFTMLPTIKKIKKNAVTYLHNIDMSNSQRVLLLLDWWNISKDKRFAKLALNISEHPVDGLDPWRDGEDTIETIYKLKSGEYFEELPYQTEISNALERSFTQMISSPLTIDDLGTISDAIQSYSRFLSDELKESFQETIYCELSDINNSIYDIDSETTLLDHIETLKIVGTQNDIAGQDINLAVLNIESKIQQLANIEESKVERFEISNSTPKKRDIIEFKDNDIINLFKPLLEIK